MRNFIVNTLLAINGFSFLCAFIACFCLFARWEAIGAVLFFVALYGISFSILLKYYPEEI